MLVVSVALYVIWYDLAGYSGNAQKFFPYELMKIASSLYAT